MLCHRSWACWHASACFSAKLRTLLLFQPVPWNWYTPPLTSVTFRWYHFTFRWKQACLAWIHTSEVMCGMWALVFHVRWYTFSQELVEFLQYLTSSGGNKCRLFPSLTDTETASKLCQLMFFPFWLLIYFCMLMLACLLYCSLLLTLIKFNLYCS